MDFKDFNWQRLKDNILATADPKLEVCGGFYHDGSIKPLVNRHAEPENNWKITDRDVRSLGDHWGIYHTHCGDYASEQMSLDDIIAAQLTWKPFFMVHVNSGVYDYYDPNHVHPFPLKEPAIPATDWLYYCGIPWEWARWDCASLVQSYFKGMFGLEFQHQPRSLNPEEFITPGWNRMVEFLEVCGFKEVDRDSPLQRHDVVVMSFVGPNPHHCGVIVDANPNAPIMLHVLTRNTLSQGEMYAGDYVHHTRYRFRLPYVKELSH